MSIDPTVIRQAAAGILPPALVAGAAALAWKALRRRSAPETDRGGFAPRVATLGLGLGFFAAFVAVSGWPRSPLQADVKEALAWVALATTALGAAVTWKQRAWPPTLVRSATAFLVPWYVLDFMREHHWSGPEAWGWCFGLALLLLAVFQLLDLLANKWPGPGLPFLYSLACSTAAGLLFWGRSASLAQLAGALAVPLSVYAFACLPAKRPPLHGGPSLVLGSLFVGLLLAGTFAAELPQTGAVALLGVLLAPLAGLLPWARTTKRRWLLALFAFLSSGTLAAWATYQSQSADPYAAYY